MLRKILAWLLNWDLVLLVDYNGNVCIRRVIEMYGRYYAWRFGMGVRKVKLLEGGKVGMCDYVHSWEIVRQKKGSKLQSLLTTNNTTPASPAPDGEIKPVVCPCKNEECGADVFGTDLCQIRYKSA